MQHKAQTTQISIHANHCLSTQLELGANPRITNHAKQTPAQVAQEVKPEERSQQTDMIVLEIVNEISRYKNRI